MISHPRVLAIIPARGGSKGIPNKNLYPLVGKPLIVYTIEEALGACSITRLVVSTDSKDIADVAQKHGAEVVLRPEELASDTASSEVALQHCLEQLRLSEGYEPELVVFLQATSPLRKSLDIDQAVATLEREGADSLFSAGPLRGFIWRCESDEVTPLNFDYRNRPRRQEAPEDLVENGSIYVFKPWVLTEEGCRLGGKIAVYRMAALDSLEIDVAEDLVLIEYLLQRRQRDGSETGN